MPIRVLSEREATEESFLDEAREYRLLHVITHGDFAGDDIRSIDQMEMVSQLGRDDSELTRNSTNVFQPNLLSGLVMAGANQGSQNDTRDSDGILRASEIESASLSGVDLVVLSACETGLGAVAGGEGLTGLQRAFQIAGARSVLARLWKVDDKATTELMGLFYQNLWAKNMTKLDALHDAQLLMIRNYDPQSGELRGLGGKSVQAATKPTGSQETKRCDARFWAAFQLSGDWR